MLLMHFCWTTVPLLSSLTAGPAFYGGGTKELRNGGLEKSYI